MVYSVKERGGNNEKKENSSINFCICCRFGFGCYFNRLSKKQ